MLKNLFLLLISASLLFGCANNISKSDTLTEKEVSDFILHYDELWAKRDTTGMKAAMAENYIYFSSTGNTTTRARILSWFTPADKYKVDTAKRSELSVTINGNTAIVSSRWIGSGSFDGERFSDDQRCSLTILKQDGKLKLISEHCTQIVNRH